MITIAFITDIHLDEVDMDSHGVDPYHNWQQILADIAKRKPDLVVIGGDMGGPDAYPYFFNTLNELAIPYHVIPGNHDTYADLAIHYQEPLKGDNEYLCYSFDRDGLRFIFLDSLASEVSNDQVDWLRGQLDTGLDIVLFVHHPVLAVDTPVDHLYPMHNRDELKALLNASGKSVTIFCGHYHLPNEQIIGGIRQYITPAASYQIAEKASKIKITDGPFGYRLITIADAKVTSELIWLNA